MSSYDADQKERRALALVIASVLVIGCLVFSLGSLRQNNSNEGNFPVAPTPSNGGDTASEVKETLRRAAEEYKKGNVSEAIADLKSSSVANNVKVMETISDYKRKGASKMVKLARASYSHGRYKDATEILVDAKAYGSKEAASLLPKGP